MIQQLSLELKDIRKNYHRTERELIERLGVIEAGEAFGIVQREMKSNGKRLEENKKRKLSRLLRAKDMELAGKEKDIEEEYKQNKNSVFRNCRKRDARTEGKREKVTKQERECTRKGEEK